MTTCIPFIKAREHHVILSFLISLCWCNCINRHAGELNDLAAGCQISQTLDAVTHLYLPAEHTVQHPWWFTPVAFLKSQLHILSSSTADNIVTIQSYKAMAFYKSDCIINDDGSLPQWKHIQHRIWLLLFVYIQRQEPVVVKVRQGKALQFIPPPDRDSSSSATISQEFFHCVYFSPFLLSQATFFLFPSHLYVILWRISCNIFNVRSIGIGNIRSGERIWQPTSVTFSLFCLCGIWE